MLSVQRAKIDTIDRELVRLLEARMQVVEEVAHIKRNHRLPVLDAARETQVIERVTGYLEDSRYADMVAELYTHLMRLSKEHQQRQI